MRPDTYYNGSVTSAAWVISEAKGTAGFQLGLETDEGESSSFTIWMTEKTKDRARHDLVKVLGLDPNRLHDAWYLREEAPAQVVGRRLSFRTKIEEWQGISKLRIASIGERRETDEAGPEAVAARLFSLPPTGPPSEVPPNDDDLPF